MNELNYFLSWNVNSGIRITTYRPSGASAVELADVADALTSGDASDVYCSLDGQTLDSLEDGAYWAGTSASVSALEELHYIVQEHLDSIK